MVTRMSRFLECCIHSREEERQSLTSRDARCRNGERSYRREVRTHPSYEMAGAIDGLKRWPVEWQKKKRSIAEQPYWHQLAMLATIAWHIDGMVEEDQEKLRSFQ